MADYDDITHGSNMPDGSTDMPPPEAEGLDRPDELEDALDDTNEEFNAGTNGNEDIDHSDDESLLSDVDEAVLDQFDENKLDINQDYLDQDQLRATKIKKRKRDEGDEGRPKKKERTRERARRNRDEEVGDEYTGEAGPRRRGAGGGERKPRARVEVDEETLTPDERKRRVLDRAMDAAVKKSSGIRKRKGEIVRLVC